jgi:hypothetical protein
MSPILVKQYKSGVNHNQIKNKGKTPEINAMVTSMLGLAILTRPDNPIRTRHEISGFGSTLNEF